jgi:predicted GNAT family N-acyltransferase
MIRVTRATTSDDLQTVFAIRRTVFVDEQQVAEEEEYDEFEESSRHFLARLGSTPCGTARWRTTENGVKLERFAVLPDFRSQGVGSALVEAVLADVAVQPETAGKTRYLHAQVTAIPLYAKFGFKAVGELFYECEIAHYKMLLPP